MSGGGKGRKEKKGGRGIGREGKEEKAGFQIRAIKWKEGKKGGREERRKERRTELEKEGKERREARIKGGGGWCG